MQLYTNIDSLCADYSIPLNSQTIGYLQFYTEFNTLATDITTVKCYIQNATTTTLIHPLNIIAQKNSTNTMRFLVQGLNITTAPDYFRFRFDLTDNLGNTTVLYSDNFNFDLCDNSDVLIPCLVAGQVSQYTYMNEFIGNIVYSHWTIASEKKYTPVLFLRNVAFNIKSATIEYKKVNNKPLFATNKNNHFLRSELIPKNYIQTFNEVFSFGKVQIKDVVYNIDSYSIDVIDDTDNCSLYKPNITAYEEVKTRIFCSNTCVVLSPISCEDYVAPATKEINITIDECEAQTFPIFDITNDLVNLTGFDVSEVCNLLYYSENQINFILGTCRPQVNTSEIGFYNAILYYEVCGVQNQILLNIEVTERCFDCCFDNCFE
jgi:hypothetical protein